jgi:hypothetical protein
MLVELPPGFRQRQTPAGAIEQAHAKFFFQSANAPAEFRRLQPEAARGRRVASMLDHLCEEPKIIEVSDCVHGQTQTPSDRSICDNDAFQFSIYAQVDCEYSIRLIACASAEFGGRHS